MEQQGNVKFCARLGKTPLDTCQLLREVYGNQALSQSAVQEIYRSLGENRHEDDERTSQISKLLKREPTYSTELIGDLVGLPCSHVYNIVTQKLQLREICSRLVPNPLRESDRRARLAFCRDFTLTVGNDSRLLKSLVIGGLFWCSELTIPKKRIIVKNNLIRPHQSSWLRTRLVVFFDELGMVHHEFVPVGHSLNAEYQAALMRRLCIKVDVMRPQYKTDYSWSLLYDEDSLGHKSVLMRSYLTQKNVSLIDLPAHSPDLAPCQFFLYPRLKEILHKEDSFDNMPDFQTAVKDALICIDDEEFDKSYGKLMERCVDCIAVEGQYFGK